MKPNLNKFTRLMLLSGVILLLGSCLKNNKYYNDFTKYEPSVEIPFAAKNLNSPIGIDWSPDTTTSFRVVINLASVEKLGSPVTATLGIDKAFIDQYNILQDAAAKKSQQDYIADPSHKTSDPKYPYSWTPMEVLPDSLYTVSAWDLTIPANERQAYADVLIKTDQLPDGHNYVLPFTITKASIDISSWNHLPLWFISSPFSGTFKGFHAHMKGGAYDEIYEDDAMTLATIDQHTVAEPGSIGDFFGGYTEYHFNGDGSVSVSAGSSVAAKNSYGATVLESSSNPQTGEFYVKFTFLAGKYTAELWFER
jgi:hypothetical protein